LQFRVDRRFDLKAIFPALWVSVVWAGPHPVRNFVPETVEKNKKIIFLK